MSSLPPPPVAPLETDFHRDLALHAAHRLGEVLVEHHAVNPRHLALALEAQKNEANQGHWVMLGQVLEDWGLATPAQVDEALNAQTIENEPVHFHGRAHPSVDDRVKRLIDITGALVGLGLTVAVLPFVALAIHLEDGGPVFFQQHRVGRHGWQFPIWKFRTMVPDADRLKLSVAAGDPHFFSPKGADPRVTKVGAVLRKTLIDELPQFWNVLKGEMSLVGTRPPTLDEVCHYSAQQWRRLEVKPGLTGMWQVAGHRHLRTFDDVVALDLEYQKRWSIGLDLAIIVRTVLGALGRGKAL
jgi:lipopolysaccharide/colanic/teichoic acid biosynthesis glycosyltransferase